MPERSSESPTHPDAPRAGGETPSLDLEATLRVLRIVEYDLKHRDDAPAPNPTSNEIHAEYAETLAALRAALLARHRDGERWQQHIARKFPIQDGPDIPWSAIEPFEKQARRNHNGQTLERLAERGGLSTHEALHVLRCIEWNRRDAESQRIMSLSIHGAIQELIQIVSAPPSPERAPHD